MTRTERPHGRAKYVMEHCQCDVCREANNAYQRTRARQRGYGRAAYVDAEPARAHLRALGEAGIGWRRAAGLAGLSSSVVSKLLYGRAGCAPSKRIRAATAEKILAVEACADALADKAVVDATGTRRRLRALVAIGWTQTQLAERLGLTPNNLWPLVHVQSNVTAARRRAVAELYDELWNKLPADDALARKSRRYAQQHGWVAAGVGRRPDRRPGRGTGWCAGSRAQAGKAGKTAARGRTAVAARPRVAAVGCTAVWGATGRDRRCTAEVGVTVRCQAPTCNRPLTSEESKRRGMGPVCWRRNNPASPLIPAVEHPAGPNQLSTEDIVTEYERVILKSDTRGRIVISAEEPLGFCQTYRLAGPEYLFDEDYETLARVELDERAVEKLRQYLAIWDEIHAARQTAAGLPSAKADSHPH